MILAPCRKTWTMDGAGRLGFSLMAASVSRLMALSARFRFTSAPPHEAAFPARRKTRAPPNGGSSSKMVLARGPARLCAVRTHHYRPPDPGDPRPTGCLHLAVPNGRMSFAAERLVLPWKCLFGSSGSFRPERRSELPLEIITAAQPRNVRPRARVAAK